MVEEPPGHAKFASTGPSGRVALTARAIEEVARTVRTAIRVLGWCFAAWSLYRIVDALAGRTTSLLVRVVLNVLFDIRFVVLLGSAAAAVIWALAERKLRQRTIRRLHPRIKQLEAMLDPRRGASHLTPTGETNPMDDAP